MSADDYAVCVRPDEPTYTDEDIRALAGVLETWLGERVLPEDAASLLAHLLAHGWAKRADVLEEFVETMTRAKGKLEAGSLLEQAGAAALDGVVIAYQEKIKDARHSSAKVTEDRP